MFAAQRTVQAPIAAPKQVQLPHVEAGLVLPLGKESSRTLSKEGGMEESQNIPALEVLETRQQAQTRTGLSRTFLQLLFQLKIAANSLFDFFRCSLDAFK